MEKESYLGCIKDNELKERIGKGKTLTHISLFTGCGGLDVGFAKAGIKTRVMVEFDKSCCKTLRHNFLWDFLKKRTDHKGKIVWKTKKDMKKNIKWYHSQEPVIIENDIKKVTTEEILKAGNLKIGETSIISGGFPCQGFSMAGKRKINDLRNALYKEFVRIVDEAKPALIFGENVPGLASMDKGRIIKQICEDFANCGYDIAWKILNAADYGVPQKRKRIILIGKRIDMMRVKEYGSTAIHIAVHPGEISYPDNWMKKYGIKLGCKEPEQQTIQKRL